MDLRCPQHPNYKGLRDKKRFCAHCSKIREAVLAAKRKKSNEGRGEQMSLSTHGYRCGMVHLLAEIGTLMMFGPQPRFFWRQNSGSRPEVRQYFQKQIKNMLSWQRRTPGVFKEIAGIIWAVWGKEFQNKKAEEVLSVVEEPVETTEPEAQEHDDDYFDWFADGREKTLDEIFGDNDGKTEED